MLVTWNDAVEFCKWLSQRDRHLYRLPTEAEWEYACRAGTETLYANGDQPERLALIGNVADASGKARFPGWTGAIKANDGYVFTAPVGRFAPNAWGLFDMHGNVWEWCADGYSAKYYKVSPSVDPAGPSPASARVIRGGSCDDVGNRCRSASRNWNVPTYRDFGLGFRVARVSSRQ